MVDLSTQKDHSKFFSFRIISYNYSDFCDKNFTFVASYNKAGS